MGGGDYSCHGSAVVLIVNPDDWTITNGVPFEFEADTSYVRDTVLSKIDDTHHLCVYGDADYEAWAVVLTVDPSDWTVTKEIPFDFDKYSQGIVLSKIDDAHHLCVSDCGWAVMLTVEIPSSVDINKWVWDETTQEWVESIGAEVDETVSFKIEVHNDGGYDLTDIEVVDTLPVCLEYVGGSADPAPT
ncbi:unnamed protein product, partial [marine sediment metagenome]